MADIEILAPKVALTMWISKIPMIDASLFSSIAFSAVSATDLHMKPGKMRPFLDAEAVSSKKRYSLSNI